MISGKTSLTELAVMVSTALQKRGIEAVLTGGAAVVLWTHGESQSFDLDFISPAGDKLLRSVMQTLGFHKRGKDYVHPDTPYFVAFPSGPLAVGQALANTTDTVTVQRGRGSLRVISPTFSVMDRLAQYFYWNDRSALDQAIAVAEQNTVDLKRVKAWAKTEGMLEKFETFQRGVSARELNERW